jgi:hypothetical protein
MGNSLTNAFANSAAVFGSNVAWTSPEGITAIATSLVAGFTLLTLFSIVFLRRQIRSDHDRSRREMAINLMKCYSTIVDPTNHELVFGFELLKLLTKEQCRSLWQKEPFTVERKHQHLLECWRSARNSAGKSKTAAKGTNSDPGPGVLSVEEVYLLRFLANTLLNRLEMIAGAWHYNVADSKIVQQEFWRVYCPHDGNFILEDYREASGVFPSIATFCAVLKENKEKSVVAKPPIGA